MLQAGLFKIRRSPHLPPQVQAQMIPDRLEKFTLKTTSRARLEVELNRIREARHCVSRGAVSDQLVSVSVPVLAFDGSVIAAPAFRAQGNDIQRYIILLKDAASKISAGLAGDGRPLDENG